MKRYSIIDTKMKREFILLQGQGCKWAHCTFCDYYNDVCADPYAVNAPVLDMVTGEYGVLDIINSGSAAEFDVRTLEHIRRVVIEKDIKTLWFEMHYMYRKQLSAFAAQFPCEVKFRTGIESFDPILRKSWRKGIPDSVTPKDVAEYFKGVCLLCCTEGDSKERILRDIEIARENFEYFSVNVFCNNTSAVKRDIELAEWFEREVYPVIKNDPRIEVLLNNTDLGVG